MPPMGGPIGTGHHDPAAITQAGTRTRLMRGGELRRPSPREGRSATSAMRRFSAIAAGKVSAQSNRRGKRRLQPSAKRPQGLRLA